MYLLIDPSQDAEIGLHVFTEKGGNKKVVQGEIRSALSLIDHFLSEQKMSSKDITGIAVVLGAGRFTGTRVAVTIANTWGYAAQIPVLGVFADEVGEYMTLAARLAAQPVGVYIAASYSAEPNIGKKK